jgi:hypothetical protein|nr:MAG TPA: virion morphogenesis protein [Caudoviricetes sp.]
MSSVKVKFKTKYNDLPEISATLETIGNRKVKVGALKGQNAWLAGIHEYGCTIKVTPKMRSFLHRQGLHLKSTTTVIKIPERSFLRNGHDANADNIMKKCEKALGAVVSGKMDIDTWLDMYGQMFATAIKKYMRDLSSPPNHPFTQDQKGSSNPLIDTGGLLESITWERD